MQNDGNKEMSAVNGSSGGNQAFSAQEPWVLFRLNNQTFGIPAHITQEMISIPEVTPVPRSPESVRGVINLRGSVIALIDLRIKLNQPSLAQELGEMISHLGQREQEHNEWMDALEAHVREGAAFTQPRSPHECAFGKWYDNFHTDNPQLLGVLLRFDSPHKMLHALADKVEGMLNRGDHAGAVAAVEEARHGLMPRLGDLFDELKRSLTIASRQEIAIVVEQDNTVIAITVDAVDAVESLQASSVEDLPGRGSLDDSYIVHMLGRRSSNGDPVLIPDLGKIVRESSEYVRNLSNN
ncbi:MAG: chemotaxis protein CheW [Desulfarculales bacterium]|jgi:purine-binding chemotaxis protein CheW|nr:chemotaxis protein CheW [Desulfarculales bacterium]